MKLTCKTCEVVFRKVGSNNTKFCSRLCRTRYYESRRTRPESRKTYMQKYAETHRELIRATQRRIHHNHRRAAIKLYGGKCKCCGTTIYEFLIFDHINGGGCEERRKLFPNAQSFYRFLSKNFLPEKYRILCQNCNAAYAYYGKCPHQLEAA